MLSGRFRQVPSDHIRQVQNLHGWLASDETIDSLEVFAPAEITVDNVLVLPPDARSYQFYAGGGTAGWVYDFAIVMTSTQGQKLTDNYQLMVQGV